MSYFDGMAKAKFKKRSRYTICIPVVKKCELFSHLAFSNFALAPFICLQLSILLPSCRRAEVAVTPGAVETKLVQVTLASAIHVVA